MSTSNARKPVRTPLLRHPLLALAVTYATMYVSVEAVRRLELPWVGRLALGLLPAAAAVYMMWALAHYARQGDELERKMVAEVLSLAFAGAIVVAVAVAHLHAAGFDLHLGWEDGMGILCVLYLGAVAVTRWRYRVTGGEE